LPGIKKVKDPLEPALEYFAFQAQQNGADGHRLYQEFLADLTAHDREEKAPPGCCRPYRTAARAGTDSASFYVIDPGQLFNLWEEGYIQRANQLTGLAKYDLMEQAVRQHGGAVLNTGSDGTWDVKAIDIEGNPARKLFPGHHVEEKDYLPPYGTAKEAVDRVAQRFLRASMSRHCEFYKAKNGKWYMDLAPNEYGDYRDANTYGPFQSLDAAEKYLSSNFSNPGADDVDESGDRPVPVKSPNGRPVTKPSSGRTWWS